METSKPKNCLFCDAVIKKGKKGNKAREHIFPKWLQEILGVSADAAKEVRQRLDDVEETTVRELNLWAFLAGSCCGNCNHGWMSSLEVEAADLLTALSQGTRDIAETSLADRTLLSLWAAKTAYAYLAGSATEIRCPTHHCHELFETRRVPDGVHVFMSQFARGEKYGFWSSNWAVYGTFDLSEHAQMKSGYKVILQFGHLVLCVAYLPVRRWKIGYNTGALALIYGDSGRVAPLPDATVPNELHGYSQMLEYFFSQSVALTGVSVGYVKVLTLDDFFN